MLSEVAKANPDRCPRCGCALSGYDGSCVNCRRGARATPEVRGVLGEFANHEEYLRYIWGRGWAFKIAAAEPSCKSLRSSGEAQPSSLVESTKSHGMKPPV